MTNIEVESRGPLSMEDFARAKNFLEKNGRFKGENKRLSLMYFRNKFPKDMTEIKDEKVDLRIRVTNGQAELVLKYGTFSASDSRKEISIFFAQTEHDEPYYQEKYKNGFDNIPIKIDINNWKNSAEKWERRYEKT